MACYLPSPRQLGFANQIIFNQTPTPPLVAPSHAAWGFAALGKAGFDIPAGPIPLLLKFRLPMGVSSFPGILIWLMNHPPFLWVGVGWGAASPGTGLCSPGLSPSWEGWWPQGTRSLGALPACFVLQPLILPGVLPTFMVFHLLQVWGKQLSLASPLMYQLQGPAVALGNWQQ